jgi:hypothetical protein
MADAVKERYGGLAYRVVTYPGEGSIEADPKNVGRWGEIARALEAG